MSKPLGYADTLDHNAGTRRNAGPAKLSHIEVTHYMTNGSSERDRVEPGKMGEHLADCTHCGESISKSEDHGKASEEPVAAE